MQRRTMLRTFAIIGLLGVLLLPTRQALASSAYISSGQDGIRQNVWVSFETARTVAGAPWGVAFQKYDGPRLQMRIFQCGNPNNVNPNEPIAADEDPPYDFINPRPDNQSQYPVTFCLQVKSLGNDATDEFEGYLYWD